MKDEKINNILEKLASVSDKMDKKGFTGIANKLDNVFNSIAYGKLDSKLIKTAGEKMDYKDWEIHHESLKGNDWALNVSRGEEEESSDPILVKIQNGIMTVRHKGIFYKSGIKFESEYFFSDKFKNSIARAFRGLQTGKVSFTSVQEMYDLQKVKGDKTKKKVEDKEDIEPEKSSMVPERDFGQQ